MKPRVHGPPRWRQGAALLGALGLLCSWAVPALRAAPAKAAPEYSEYAVKAAFLYRFAQYVDWPAGTPTGQSFTIAVLSAPQVERELERFLPGHSIQGAPAAVRAIRGVHELGDARMLYIGPERDAAAVIATLPARPILVVTDDAEAGLDAGGTVNFMVVDRRVRFEISLATAERLGLHIRSELLAVAERVQGLPRRTDSRCRGPKAFGDPGLRCLPVLARR